MNGKSEKYCTAKAKRIGAQMIEKRNGEEAKTPLAYDDILREIGEFGAYQLLVGLTVGFVFAYGSFVTMNFVFSADTTEHRYDFTFLNRNSGIGRNA